MTQEKRPVTLITGASSGIGAALAHEFAANGHELVLIARREQVLAALADAIAAKGASRPTVLPADVARADATQAIAEALDRLGLEPDVVVNNAGFGLLGAADTLDRAEQLAMIDLNARTLTDLSLRWIDSVTRHRGGILNVASLAGFIPGGPNMAVYFATKAYALSFSEALHSELKPKGVRVTVLAPGPVPTEFQGRAGIRPRKRDLLTVSPERAAREGYAGFARGRRVVVPGLGNKFVAFLPRIMPRSLILSVIHASQSRRAKPKEAGWPRRRPESSG